MISFNFYLGKNVHFIPGLLMQWTLVGWDAILREVAGPVWFLGFWTF